MPVAKMLNKLCEKENINISELASSKQLYITESKNQSKSFHLKACLLQKRHGKYFRG